VKKSISYSKNEELTFYVKEVMSSRYSRRKKIDYPTFLNDKFLVARAVKRGVPFDLFEEIKSNAPFSDQQWSEYLHINIRTLQRYNKEKDHVFKPLQSEKIFELAEVIHTGYKVFDSPEDLSTWLNSPSLALGNIKPVSLLDSSYGIDLVLAELNRIEYGVFA
jgi:putative toxin-antitoxin system antitoxin component (TIGR02293 family)